MKSKELKLVDDLANATDDRWFNPTIMGIALSNQPLYTLIELWNWLPISSDIKA